MACVFFASGTATGNARAHQQQDQGRWSSSHSMTSCPAWSSGRQTYTKSAGTATAATLVAAVVAATPCSSAPHAAARRTRSRKPPLWLCRERGTHQVGRTAHSTASDGQDFPKQRFGGHQITLLGFRTTPTLRLPRAAHRPSAARAPLPSKSPPRKKSRYTNLHGIL